MNKRPFSNQLRIGSAHAMGCLAALVAGALGTVAGPIQAQPVAEVRVIVVGPQAWQTELEHYAGQRPAAIHCQVVSWETLVADAGAADEPEAIKRFLYNQWQASGLDHVLLVGDASTTPVRYMVLDRVTPAAHDYAFYASDLYYADLARPDRSFDDWNAVKEGYHARYFGEVRGEKHKTDPINFDQVDYLPEVGIGRWPVRSLEELQCVIAKSLAYEQAVLHRDFPAGRTVGLIAVDGWVDSRPHLDRTAERLTGWQVDKLYYASGSGSPEDGLPTRENVVALFERGSGLIFHAGHGHPREWHACVSLDALSAVATAGRWPIVLSAGCSTAVFAPQAPYEAYLDADGNERVGTNAGERFEDPPPPPAAVQPVHLIARSMGTELLTSPNGAVAYSGCATGSQPCALTLLEGFAASIGGSNEASCLGESYRGMIAHYFEAERLSALQPTPHWYPPSIFFQGMKFVMFGDPSLPLPIHRRDDTD